MGTRGNSRFGSASGSPSQTNDRVASATENETNVAAASLVATGKSLVEMHQTLYGVAREIAMLKSSMPNRDPEDPAFEAVKQALVLIRSNLESSIRVLTLLDEAGYLSAPEYQSLRDFGNRVATMRNMLQVAGLLAERAHQSRSSEVRRANRSIRAQIEDVQDRLRRIQANPVVAKLAYKLAKR